MEQEQREEEKVEETTVSSVIIHNLNMERVQVLELTNSVELSTAREATTCAATR
jgi:hypothetical protein